VHKINKEITANLGLTIETDGLSANVVLERTAAQSVR